MVHPNNHSPRAKLARSVQCAALALTLETQPGTYALLLSSAANRPLQIGRLGQCCVRPGFYVYVGSACGPGGVRARVAHHCQPAARPHWHIDYLRTVTQIEAIWYTYDSIRWEHVWADVVQHLYAAVMPLRRFGASDCACASHLYFFPTRPSWSAFRRRLRHTRRDHPLLYCQQREP
jgi:Uri superfamily endonuclease